MGSLPLCVVVVPIELKNHSFKYVWIRSFARALVLPLKVRKTNHGLVWAKAQNRSEEKAQT